MFMNSFTLPPELTGLRDIPREDIKELLIKLTKLGYRCIYYDGDMYCESILIIEKLPSRKCFEQDWRGRHVVYEVTEDALRLSVDMFKRRIINTMLEVHHSAITRALERKKKKLIKKKEYDFAINLCTDFNVLKLIGWA